VSRGWDQIPPPCRVPDPSAPGPDKGRHRREGLRGEQAPGFTVPDLPAAATGDRPESSEEARPVAVDGQLAAIVILETAELPRDQGPAFGVARHTVAERGG
jgi:hypothetical protein